MRRSGKEYRKIEKDSMELLGLKQTKNSGSGWVEKEDGESENVLCQLKSTDAQSIKVSKMDLDTLQYHAFVSHKIPVFAIQFLGSDELYLVIKPDNMEELSLYLKTGKTPEKVFSLDLSDRNDICAANKQVIKSNLSAREMFYNEKKKKYKKKRSAI